MWSEGELLLIRVGVTAMEVVDPFVLQCFTEELQRGSAIEEDWDFAYRCQIEETLAASLCARNEKYNRRRKSRRGATESPGTGNRSEDVEREILARSPLGRSCGFWMPNGRHIKMQR